MIAAGPTVTQQFPFWDFAKLKTNNYFLFISHNGSLLLQHNNFLICEFALAITQMLGNLFVDHMGLHGASKMIAQTKVMTNRHLLDASQCFLSTMFCSAEDDHF